MPPTQEEHLQPFAIKQTRRIILRVLLRSTLKIILGLDLIVNLSIKHRQPAKHLEI